MFVVDNSVVMRWLFRDGSDLDRSYAAMVAARVEVEDVHVPALFIPEAANVIARALRSGTITRQQSAECFALIQAMQATVDHDADPHAVSATALLAFDTGLSAYDASYLRLAQTLGCALATLDADLRNAALQCGVELVKTGG